ncbi:hypothetical protein D6C78_11002 [Aureobasidium pullulans]|uniref:Uncharacterized protein n=1 Tax=Aureobasidium pullulans TaxID=5580 RepID=A0A4V6TKL9_AURPU|nr:hypothetical protein D6C78_11002 [Aureobasidium pullulans]
MWSPGAGFGDLIAAIVVIGKGTGSIKASVTPMCAEQYRLETAYVKTLKPDERVVVVRNLKFPYPCPS